MKKNVLIATCAMDNCSSHFMYSMVRMIQQHPEYDFLPRIGSECHVSRDWLCFYAMHNNYDYICIVDSDETFKPDAVEKLIADDKDIVSGIVCKREPPYEPIIYKFNEDNESTPWETIMQAPKELTRVDATGGGAMTLIKVTALRKVYHCTGDMFFPINHWSDDLSFFYRCRQCGMEVWVDPRVKLGHAGIQVVTTDYWEAIHES